jgi:CrcB protein
MRTGQRLRLKELELPPMLAVSLGGAVGAVARYGVAELVDRSRPGAFPWDTLAVNLIGSFLLGLLLALLGGPARRSTARLLFGTGMLGAFTTFSTFSLDTVNLLRNDAGFTAIIYVTTSLAGGLALALAGVGVARRLRNR